MPTLPVYVRKENYDTWLALDNPGAWVNEQLNKLGGVSVPASPAQKMARTPEQQFGPRVTSEKDVKLLAQLKVLDAEIPEEAFGEFKHEIRGNEVWLTQIGGEDRKRGFLNPKTNEFVRYN